MKASRPLAGIHPFWFWNGEMNDEEVREQVRAMASQGIDGFFIHPRQGLSVPYLSRAFFDRVAAAIDEAERRGLAVHLYDEYPYPSGIAGGWVTEGTPEHMATSLVHERREVEGGAIALELPRGRVLSCVAFPVRGTPDWGAARDLLPDVGMRLADDSFYEGGLTAYNQKRYFASRPVPVLRAALPPGRWLISVSVQALVTRFKYWGYYVDVLSPEAVEEFITRTHESYAARFADRFGRSVFSIFTDETEPQWSSRLPPFFRQEWGYDLREALPALALAEHPDHRRVLRDFADARYRLFCSVFEQRVGGWCRDHGILYAGEKPSFTLSQLKYMDIPGCDPGHTKAGALPDLLLARIRRNAKAVASAAFFYRKPSSLCECFHSLGWSGTLLDARLIAEALLLLGIRMLVPHGFFYTTHGLAKHDAPPTFFFQMPYWFLMNHLTARVAAIQERLEGTEVAPSLLVYDPSAGLPLREEQEQYSRLLYALMGRRIDFLIVDREILSQSVLPPAMATLPLIVPPMDCPERDLESVLAAHTARGGTVLRIERGDDALPALPVESHLRLRATGATDRLWMVTRRNREGRRLWLFLNTSDAALSLDFEPDRRLEEVALGEPGLARLRGNQRKVLPFESFMLAEAAGAAAERAAPAEAEIAVPQRVAFDIHSDNVLRIDRWELSLADAPDFRRIVASRPIVNQLAEGQFPIRPGIETHFGWTPELSIAAMHACYRGRFDCAYAGAVRLVMEPGSLRGDWRIRINDGAPLAAADFSPSNSHVRGSLECDVTAMLLPGANTLEVTIGVSRGDDGLVNPLYLAGRFGVFEGPSPDILRIADLPREGSFEDYQDNGLPFFSGTLEYRFASRLRLPQGDACRLELLAPRPFQEAAEISLNDGPRHPLPWMPYQAIAPAAEMRDGDNQVRLFVHTTLIRSFEGEYFDIPRHACRPCLEPIDR